MKRKAMYFAALLAAVTAVVFSALSVSAESGSFGENLNWNFEDGILTISGSGDMDDLSSGTDAPWSSFRPDIRSIHVGSGITSVGYRAFDGCSRAESVVIADGVTSIGYWAFEGCSSLESISLPESVEMLDDYAFSGCTSLKSISLPAGITEINEGTFWECSALESVTLPENLDMIGNRAFVGCTSLTDITLPEGLASIGDDAFDGCTALTRIVIPSSVVSVGTYAFYNCKSLSFASIPPGMRKIDNFTFCGDSALETVSIPSGITSIGTGSFQNCSALRQISIPAGLKSVGYCAFDGCTALKDIYYSSDDNAWQEIYKDDKNDSLTGAAIHYGDYPITVIVNGRLLSMDQPPVITDGRTLVPLRAIFEALGASVQWIEQAQTVTSEKNGTEITLSIGSREMTINDEAVTLDVPAAIIGGRTMVPARAVSEAFGCGVDWYGDIRTVVIND